MRCAVKTCTNKKTLINENCISFFHFPSNKELREQWLQFCGRTEPLSKYWRVCRYHFREEDIIGKAYLDSDIPRRMRLKEGAVPTIAIKVENEFLDNDDDDGYDGGRDGGHNYDDVVRCSNAECRTQNVKLTMELKALQRENQKLIRDAQRKEHEYKHKDCELNKAVIMLKNAERVCNNMENRLKDIFTTGQIHRLKEGLRSTHWAPEDIARSYKLYSASPQGYRLLRKNKFPLPGIRTLQRWASKRKICPRSLEPSSSTIESNNTNE